MSIITTYPLIGEVAPADLLIIADMSILGTPTRTVSIQQLVDEMGGSYSWFVGGAGGFEVTASETVTFTGGIKLTAVNNSGNQSVTFNHDNTSRTDTTSAVTPGSGGTFTVIDSIVQDATGHTTAVNTKTVTMPSGGGGNVISVGLSAPSAFTVSNSPVTTSGTLTFTGAGTTAQFIDGTGSLQAISSIPGGVSQIVAGQNVTISPVGGTGVVTINASGGGGGGTVTNVDASTGGDALDVFVSDPTTTPDLAFTWAGTNGQYVNGEGNLIDLPATATTYNLDADQDGLNVDLNLTPSVGIADVVKLTAGTGIALTETGNNNITIATSGNTGLTSVGASSNYLTISNSPLTSNGVIQVNVPANGVIVGTYNNATVTVDQYGFVTSVSSGPVVPNNIVETVTTTDGQFIELTPNSPTSGAVAVTADLSATGTPSSTTFLRGDNTWAVPSGGGGGGTMSSWIAGDGSNTQTITDGDQVNFNATTKLSSNISLVAGVVELNFSHDSTSRSDTTSTYSLGSGGSFTKVDSVTTDSTGHITAINLGTVNIDSFDNYGSWTLSGDGGQNQVIFGGNTVDIIGGLKIATVSSNTNILTINHDSTTRSDTSSSVSPAAGGTFTVVDSITQDVTGHITATNLKTVTLPSGGGSMSQWFIDDGGAGGFAVQNNDSVIVEPGDKIDLVTSTALKKLIWSHEGTTRNDTTSAVTPGSGGTFTVVDSITQDATGHPTAINVKTVTMPTTGGGGGGPTYDLTSAQDGNNVDIKLTPSTGAVDIVQLTAGTGVTLADNGFNNITISASGANSVNETTPGTSSGIPIEVSPTTGNVLVKSMAYAGTTNVGHVPAGGTSTTFLRGDGSWQIPSNTEYLAGTGMTLQGNIFKANVSGTLQSVAPQAVTGTSSRTYAIQVDGSNDLVVNVPWTGGSPRGAGIGLTLNSNNIDANVAGTQTTAANSVSTTASRTYAVQVDSTDNLVVNVPWTDTGGSVTSVAAAINGNAYVASVNNPTTTPSIAIVPQGNSSKYINGAGDLADISTLPAGVTSITPAASTGSGTPITSVGNITFTGAGGITTSVNAANVVTITGSGGGGGGGWAPSQGGTFANADIYNVNWNNAGATARTVVIGDDQMSSDQYAALEVHGRISVVDPYVRRNTFVGFESGKDYVGASAGGNTGVGYQTLRDNTDGQTNTAVGRSALTANTTGDGNTAIGFGSQIANTTGRLNTSVGDASLNTNILGNFNVGVGPATLQYLLQHDNNVAVGYRSLIAVQNENNTAVGTDAGQAMVYGKNNVCLGYQAGYDTVGTGSLDDGNENVFIGARSGLNNAYAQACIYIGYETEKIPIPPAGTIVTNETVIGHKAIGKGTNTVVLGNDDVERTHLKGIVLLEGYTFASLPVHPQTVVGMRTYITDGVSPTYGGIASGGGSSTVPVFYNGTNWIYA